MIDSSVNMLGNKQKETLKHDPPLIMMVPHVERMFGRLATRYNRRRVFSHQDALFWSVVTVFENGSILVSLILVLLLILCSVKAGAVAAAAAAAMDYMPPQFPTLPTESTDIFSLSDQVLSDRLEFIEEVGSIPFDVKNIIWHSSW